MSSSPSTEESLQERVCDLEVRLSYQDKLLGDLDEVLQLYVKRIEVLERRLGELQDSMAAVEYGPQNEKPPHY